MIKKIFTALFLSFILCQAFAQKINPDSRWKFHSLNEIGLLQGESKTAFHLQLVNGFQKTNWFAGIGAGLDYYRYKSIPLFAEGRKYFGKTKNQFFVYADAGVNFVWEKKNNTAYSTEKYTPGFYGNGGIGYKAGFRNGMAFLLSGGFRYKRINDLQQQQTFCFGPGPCAVQTDKYTYDLNCLVVQIGLMF